MGRVHGLTQRKARGGAPFGIAVASRVQGLAALLGRADEAVAALAVIPALVVKPLAIGAER